DRARHRPHPVARRPGRHDRRRHPPLPRPGARRGARRPAPAHRRDPVARPGDRRGYLPGRAAGHDAGARAPLGDRLRLAEGGGAAAGPAAVRHRDRRARHPLHPRPLAGAERPAADRHPRLARLGHRAAEDHRPPHRPHRARRERGGRVRRRHPFHARLRLLRQADHDRLGPRAHGPRLGGADAAPRLRPLRRPGRRLGRVRRRPDGPAGAGRTARHPHQHAGHRARRRRPGAPGRRRAAPRPLRRGAARLRAAGPDLQAGRVRQVHGGAPADPLRDRRFARRPGRLAARPQRRRRPAGGGGRRGPEPDHERHGRADPRRGPRQHHALLADEHGGLRVPPLLGVQGRLLQRQGRLHPG
ncbi:MAG: Epoxide hydrolase, partial [uncultured Thermomicrobiales bacterium]